MLTVGFVLHKQGITETKGMAENLWDCKEEAFKHYSHLNNEHWRQERNGGATNDEHFIRDCRTVEAGGKSRRTTVIMVKRRSSERKEY